jgi:glycosyltransferase involved in cell wall biosynthesis
LTVFFSALPRYYLPLFSVIIPTYNRAALIGQAVDSVFAQMYNDYEVIVVDDGSTDRTTDVLQDYGDRIRVLHQQNTGPGAARNAGVRQARGVYVAFLDSDDVWFPWTLATYYSVIQAYDRPSFVCGDCLKFTHADEIPTVPRLQLVHEKFEDYYAAVSQQDIWVGTCGTAILTGLLVEMGGFMEGYTNAEDSDLWLRLGTGRGFVHVTAPLVFGYRQSLGSARTLGHRTYAGLREMVLKEHAGAYPGGMARRRERLEIITRHVRPASIGCLRAGNWKGAWWLYRYTLRWQITLKRYKYMMAVPALSLLRFMKPRRAGVQ